VIGGSAHADRILFERAKCWRGFPRIEDRNTAPGSVYELTRKRRNARQMLQKIQRCSLSGQQRACRTGDMTNRAAGVALVAIVNMPVGSHAGVELYECFERNVEPRQRARRFCEKHTAPAIVLTEDGVRCDVAAREIFFERTAHEIAVLTAIKPLGLGQTQPLP
jgi:hypothetical protein